MRRALSFNRPSLLLFLHFLPSFGSTLLAFLLSARTASDASRFEFVDSMKILPTNGTHLLCIFLPCFLCLSFMFFFSLSTSEQIFSCVVASRLQFCSHFPFISLCFLSLPWMAAVHVHCEWTTNTCKRRPTNQLYWASRLRTKPSREDTRPVTPVKDNC